MSEKHGLNCDCDSCVEKRAFSLSAKLGYPIDYAKKIILNEIAEAKASEQALIEESATREQQAEARVRRIKRKASRKIHVAKEKLKAVQQLEFELQQTKEKMLDIESRFKTLIEQRDLAESYLMEERKRFEIEIAKINKELQQAYDQIAKINGEKNADYWKEFAKFRDYYLKQIKHLEKRIAEEIEWQKHLQRADY